MCPVKGLSEVRRLPRCGKVRLGEKVEGQKGTYPRPLDYFKCPPEVQEVFGEKPTELRIMFPVEDETLFAPQWYKCYSQTRGLICRGDGEVADRTIDVATGALANRQSKEVVRKEVPCQGRECPDFERKQCRVLMSLQFLLPEVPDLGVWQVDTSSIYGILNVNNGIDFIRSACGRIRMVPLLLRLVPQQVTIEEPGKAPFQKTVRVLKLGFQGSLAEIQERALVAPERVLLLPKPLPAEQDEPPEDIYPPEVIEQAEDAQAEQPLAPLGGLHEAQEFEWDEAQQAEWDSCQVLAKDLSIKEDGLVRWWAQRGVAASFAFGGLELKPRPTADQVREFLLALQSYQERRARKGRAATP